MIIGLVVGLIIGIIIGFTAGIFFVSSEDREFIADNNPLSTFDCAKSYDKWRTFMDSDKSSYGYSNSLSTEYFIYGHFELMENRCFITVKSWAHESDYEPLIWSTNWESLSHMNQMYLGEIPCMDPKTCEDIKEKRDQYGDYLKSKK